MSKEALLGGDGPLENTLRMGSMADEGGRREESWRGRGEYYGSLYQLSVAETHPILEAHHFDPKKTRTNTGHTLLQFTQIQSILHPL